VWGLANGGRPSPQTREGEANSREGSHVVEARENTSKRTGKLRIDERLDSR